MQKDGGNRVFRKRCVRCDLEMMETSGDRLKVRVMISKSVI